MLSPSPLCLFATFLRLSINICIYKTYYDAYIYIHVPYIVRRSRQLWIESIGALHLSLCCKSKKHRSDLQIDIHILCNKIITITTTTTTTRCAWVHLQLCSIHIQREQRNCLVVFVYCSCFHCGCCCCRRQAVNICTTSNSTLYTTSQIHTHTDTHWRTHTYS